MTSKASGGGGFWETVLSFFMKSGPWAVLSLLLIFGIAYELHVVITTVGAKVSDYVVTSGSNLQELVVAQQKSTEAHTLILSSTAQLNNAVTDASYQIVINGDHIRQLQTLLQDACTAMKATVERQEGMSKEQIDLLKKLEAGIQELNKLTIENQQIALETKDNPNGG